jgi:outer membrane protein OmpA-like peptidoglycan-associated protein
VQGIGISQSNGPILHRQQVDPATKPPGNLGPPVSELPLPPICSLGWKNGGLYWKCENVPKLGSTPEIPLDPRDIPKKFKELIPKSPGGSPPPPSTDLWPKQPLPQDAWETWLKHDCKDFPLLCKPGPPDILKPPEVPKSTLELPKLGGTSDVQASSQAGSLTIDGFAIDKAELNAAQKKQIDAQAAVILDLLKRYPDSFMSIVGFADAPGKESHNVELGQQRAESVMGELIAQGVPANTMHAGSLGATLKIETKGYEPRNRRVEVFFTARNFMRGGGRELLP